MAAESKAPSGRIPKEIEDIAIEYVRSFHYIDDVRYAGYYIESRSQTKSKRQIVQDLKAKGVSSEDIEAAYEQARKQRRRNDPRTCEKETHEPGESNSGRTAEILCVLYEKRIFLCCGTQGSAGARIIRRIFLATIKEIAEKAGVSTTTVSNVIHGKTKKVSPATIQKIEALIKEVGYVQKRGLRVLNNEKSQLIAVVINYHKEFKDSILGDPFYGKSSDLSKNMYRNRAIT